MENIRQTINNKYIVNNDNNVNKHIKLNNDINDNNANFNKNYALDRSKFIPNTEEAMLAEEIATEFDDINNYACYLYVVNKIGIHKSRQLFHTTKADIQEKKNTKYPVRSPKKYFMYKFKYKKY